MKSNSLFLKHLFDFLISLIGLTIFGWIIIILWLFASIDTKTNGMIKQSRIGLKGHLFLMYKLRSMYTSYDQESFVTTSDNSRISNFGRFLRKYNLDELPQLINVLNGTMSFVGPRPDVPGYADNLKGEERKILELKPGITGPASLKYANEEHLLASVDDPQKYNDEVIYPDKVKINLEYYYNRTFLGDIKIILKTIFIK